MLLWILCRRRRLWRSACVVAEKIHGFCVKRNNLCDERWSTFIRTLASSHASLYCHINNGVVTADLREALWRNSRQVKRHEEWDVWYARHDLNQRKRRIEGLGIFYTGSSCSGLDIALAESLLTRIICTRAQASYTWTRPAAQQCPARCRKDLYTLETYHRSNWGIREIYVPKGS